MTAPARGGSDELLRAISARYPRSELLGSLLELHERSDGAGAQLTRLLAGERLFGARLRRVGNTEAVALTHPIPTIRHTIEALGFRAIHCTALACALMDSMSGPCRHVHYVAFWRHTIAVGMIGQVPAAVEGKHRADAFAAGLLHNIGRLMLDQQLPGPFDRAVQLASERGAGGLSAAVADIFGCTDHEVASAAGAAWELDPPLIEMLAGWHNSEALLRTNLAGLVARSAELVAALGIGDGVEAPAGPPVERAAQVAQLTAPLQRLGGIEWLRARVDTILDAALFQ